MRSQRQSVGVRGTAQVQNIRLPVRGMYTAADSAELSPQFAAEMVNWESTGALLETRPQAQEIAGPSTTLQRLPFAFNGGLRTIKISPEALAFGDSAVSRRVEAPLQAAYVSGQAVLGTGNGAPLRVTSDGIEEAEFTSDDADPTKFDGTIAHHDRVYFWKRGSDLSFYYGELGAVMGALEQFPLGRLGSVTGSLAQLVSLTVNAGHGMNDVLCVVTTTGQMVVYEGVDPGDPEDWRLLSRIQSAPPVGPHAFVQTGSDVWMLSTRGLVSMGQTLRQADLALVSNVAQPVADDIEAAVRAGGEWQLHASADGHRVIVNRIYQGVAEQWVYSTEARAWSRADYPARFWYNLGDETRFTALDGRDMRLAQSEPDGEVIRAVLHTGWQRVGRDIALRSITPTLLASGPLEVKIAVLTDHDTTQVDRDEAWQALTIRPDTPGEDGALVSLNEPIALDAVGSVFQVRMEVEAKWVRLVSMTALLG